MDMLKSVGAVLLAGVIGMLLGGSIHAQNPVHSADSTASPLPKDIYPDSRDRLPLPKREDMDDEGKKIFDKQTQKERLAVGIEKPSFRLWDPKIAEPLGDADHYLKYETGLPDQLLEILVLVTAREMDCQYEWTQWETYGRDPGDPRHIEPAIIDMIKYEKPVVGLGEKETAIIALGREMFGRRKVSSATFAEVLRLFGRKGTVDLVWRMADYSLAAAEVAAYDQHLRADRKPLLPSRTHSQNPARSANLAAAIIAASAPLPKDIYPDSRNRFPLPKREEMDDYGKKVFDEVTREDRLPGTGFATKPPVSLYSPQVAEHLGDAYHYLNYEMGLPERLLEIAVLVTAREMDCQYEWSQWETYGRDPGDPRHIEPAIIDMIKYEKPVVGLDEKETAVITLGREMLGQRKVSSATFAEVLRLFGRKGAVDLVELMGTYSAEAAELTAFDQQLRRQKPLLPPRQKHG